MKSILPAQQPAMGSPAVLGIGGPDLTDLTEDELASVISAANAAATDALLLIWERKDQAAGEQYVAERPASAPALWTAPPPLGPETRGERLRCRALVAAIAACGAVVWAAAGMWVWS